MKTEKEFSDYFIKQCPHESKYDPLVENISKTYWKDLTTHLFDYFNNDDRLAITEKSAQLLSEKLAQNLVDNAWASVIRNFVDHNCWDYKTTSKKPFIKKTEEQKIFWTLFKFIWALFQSMIILKTAVYYFGLEAGNHPDQTSGIWVWLFFSLSASSLLFFAYRNRNYRD